MRPDQLLLIVTQRERDDLAPVYERLNSVDHRLPEYVQHAQYIEIIEEYDHRAWPNDFVLPSCLWDFQKFVALHTEFQCVDYRQRLNYMRLAMAGKNRHADVAYGLSGRLKWSDEECVVRELIRMGKREYDVAIPENHEMDNNVLHVAVSYKHTADYRSGTISFQQAKAIWLAVTSIHFGTVSIDTEVRVWIDQNLHRKRFPPGTEWHEFGLLPYACLKTVYIGDGNFSLKLAFTRPWLWVEMVAGLKSYGIHTAPGNDVSADCCGVVEKLQGYDAMKQFSVQYGWVHGTGENVDEVMLEVARLISIWRRDFMGHASYQYVDDFEKFVNWARLFVIRGVPYSEMSWNHSSQKPVRGMDAVVLIRALPRPNTIQGVNKMAVLRPTIWWKSSSAGGEWTIGDIIDRSGVDDLRVKSIMDCTEQRDEGAQYLVMMGNISSMEAVRFKKEGGTVSMVYDHGDKNEDTLQGEAFRNKFKTLELLQKLSGTVTVSSTDVYGDILTYFPFTGRVKKTFHPSRIPVGNACAKPTAVEKHVKEGMLLKKKVGIFFYDGSFCENVYEMDGENYSLRICTSEISEVLHAAGGNFAKARALASVLKQNFEYKTMRYRDMSDRQKLEITRHWPLENFEFCDQNTLSGEVEMDVELEMIEKTAFGHI